MAIKEIKLKDKSNYQSHRHSIMIAREIYILYKLSRSKYNSFTILLHDIECNPEAYDDYKQLDTVYLITSFEKIDLHSFMKNKSPVSDK